MNALCSDAYFTIHVTPEDDSSYVSYETNASEYLLGTGSYASILESVVGAFCPKRFLVSFTGCEEALQKCTSLPVTQK